MRHTTHDRANALVWLALILLAALALISSAGCSLDRQYVDADRAFYQQFEPRLNAYASTQPAKEKQAVKDLLFSWDSMITKAEKSLAK